MQREKITKLLLVAGLLPAIALGFAACQGKIFARDATTRTTEYFAVFLDGRKIGHGTNQRIDRGDRIITTETLDLTIKRAGVPLRLGMTETSEETPQGQPRGFTSIQQFSATTMKMSGTVQPSGQLEVVIETAGVSQSRSMPWPDGAMLSEGLQQLIRSKGLVSGTEYTARAFIPSYLTVFDARVKVGTTQPVDLLGRVVPLTEVSAVFSMPTGAAGAPSANGPIEFGYVTYLDSKYTMLKAVQTIMDMKIEMIACDRRFALSPNDVPDFIDQMIIPSPVPLTDIKTAKSITYHLVPKSGQPLVLAGDDNQHVKSDGQGGLYVTVAPVQPKNNVKIPYRGHDPSAISALRPTRYLQSDAEPVISLARQAVGDTTDAEQAARKIEAFVHDYIQQKDLSVGYASAAEVVQSRQGDCSEHAVLTAAMCRAVGLPTRVAVGYVYAELFGERANIFGGHAWAQVYIGDQWVGLDATRGANGYSPGHLALTVGNGDPEDFFSMIQMQNRFQIAEVKIDR